jgi:hypothetical protein
MSEKEPKLSLSASVKCVTAEGKLEGRGVLGWEYNCVYVTNYPTNGILNKQPAFPTHLFSDEDKLCLAWWE